MNADWTREDQMSTFESDRQRSGSAPNDQKPLTPGQGPPLNWGLILGSLGAGLALGYYFSPNQGGRRRADLRDQFVGAAHDLSNCMETTARDVRNRAVGLAATTSRKLRQEEVPDDRLVQRVRSALGRAVSHPRPILVSARDGSVMLQGPILSAEVEGLLATVSGVPGVRGVDNRLTPYDHPGNISALQGGSARMNRYTRAQENWSPTTRLLAGMAGTLLCAAGAGLLLRAGTNRPGDQLTGGEPGREGIELQKTINIAATPEEVFAFCATWENFPRFMSHVREVQGEGQQSHWVVDGPAGMPVSWDALVTEFIPNQLLAWKSQEGSAIRQAGMLRVDPNPDGTTRLSVHISYNPPAGALGHAVATLLGANPQRQLDEDFQRLQSLIEAGKTTTDEGEITRDDLAA